MCVAKVLPVAIQGNEKSFDLLADLGLDLEEVDTFGQTPIYYVARDNRLNLFSKLVGKGNPNLIQPNSTASTKLPARRLSSTQQRKDTSRCVSSSSRAAAIFPSRTQPTRQPVSMPRAQAKPTCSST